jgi:hypothetical protein
MTSAIDLVRNPFFVLELDADASAVDVDRQGKKLLAELELGKNSARSFASPFGALPRDEAGVRAAMAALRDPRLRSLYALFVPPRDRWRQAEEPSSSAPATVVGYPELRDVVGERSWLRGLVRAPAAADSADGGAR